MHRFSYCALFGAASLFISASAAPVQLRPRSIQSGSTTIVFDTLIEGSIPYAGLPMTAVFHYSYEAASNDGSAILKSINGTAINLMLEVRGGSPSLVYVGVNDFPVTEEDGTTTIGHRVQLEGNPDEPTQSWSGAMILGNPWNIAIKTANFGAKEADLGM